MSRALSFAQEKQIAIAAVVRACSVTSNVFQRLVSNQTLTKEDKSPVTVADFSAQAVVNAVLTNAFPQDPIVGEEDSADLRNPSSAPLRERLTALANDALHLPLRSLPEHPELTEDSAWGIGPDTPIRSTEELLELIDKGNAPGGPTGRTWTLDPIDGTLGFLSGGQYAVALALIVDSVVQVGVLGCPNLPVAADQPDGDKGCLFVAVRGQGAEQRPLNNLAKVTQLHHPTDLPSLDTISIIESVQARHSSHSFSQLVSTHLGLTASPLRMDSQAKYACLTRGQGGIYFRMPVKGAKYVEKIWDHAAGVLMVEEAGGVASDLRGQALNFGLGRTLGDNHGIVACFRDLHPKVLEAARLAREEEEKEEKQT